MVPEGSLYLIFVNPGLDKLSPGIWCKTTVTSLTSVTNILTLTE